MTTNAYLHFSVSIKT